MSGNGMGNAGEPLADEHFGFPLDVPGTVGFARGDAPHTNHQQFFIFIIRSKLAPDQGRGLWKGL